MKIYIMGATHHIGRYKIGISKNVANRRKNIEKSIDGNVYVIFVWNLFFAYFWEQTLHRIYSPLNDKNFKGSGRTEWFWMIAPITPILFILLFSAIEIGAIGAIIITSIKAVGTIGTTANFNLSQIQNQIEKIETTRSAPPKDLTRKHRVRRSHSQH